ESRRGSTGPSSSRRSESSPIPAEVCSETVSTYNSGGASIATEAPVRSGRSRRNRRIKGSPESRSAPVVPYWSIPSGPSSRSGGASKVSIRLSSRSSSANESSAAVSGMPSAAGSETGTGYGSKLSMSLLIPHHRAGAEPGGGVPEEDSNTPPRPV